MSALNRARGLLIAIIGKGELGGACTGDETEALGTTRLALSHCCPRPAPASSPHCLACPSYATVSSSKQQPVPSLSLLLKDTMHRRHAAVSPLPALSIPRSREMSALLSSTGSAPHTPTKRADPLPLFTVNTNRYSTDSWNSSNLDVADEMECEWKPEHIRFLNRVSRVASPKKMSRILNKRASPLFNRVFVVLYAADTLSDSR